MIKDVKPIAIVSTVDPEKPTFLGANRDYPGGAIPGLLEKCGLRYIIVEGHDMGDFTLDECGGVIIAGNAMGGSCSEGSDSDLLKETDAPSLAGLKLTIKEIIARDFPCLGICFGAQLLAVVMGGEVRPMGCQEVGFFRHVLEEEGKRDPIFQGDHVLMYEMHGYRIILPEQATLLAASVIGDISVPQLYRVRNNIYGCQGHPELCKRRPGSWAAFEVCFADMGVDLKQALTEYKCPESLVPFILKFGPGPYVLSGSHIPLPQLYARIFHLWASYYAEYRSTWDTIIEKWLRKCQLI